MWAAKRVGENAHAVADDTHSTRTCKRMGCEDMDGNIYCRHATLPHFNAHMDFTTFSLSKLHCAKWCRKKTYASTQRLHVESTYLAIVARWCCSCRKCASSPLALEAACGGRSHRGGLHLISRLLGWLLQMLASHRDP